MSYTQRPSTSSWTGVRVVAVGSLFCLGARCGEDQRYQTQATTNSDEGVSLEQPFSLGENGTGQSNRFGVLADATIDHAGRILVLDRAEHRLWLFSADGRRMNSTSRRGRGPNELQEPRRLAAIRDTVFVLDGGRRLVIYRIEGERLIYQDEMNLPSETFDLCTLGDKLLLLTYRDGHLVHQLRRDNTPTISLIPAHTNHALLNMMLLTDGHIVCDSSFGQVILVHALLPRISSYSLTGERRWVTSLKEFESMQITVGARSVTYKRPRGGFHDVNVEALTIGPYLLVQTGRVDKRIRNTYEIEQVRSYLLSLSGEEVVKPVQSLPRLAFSSDSTAIHLGNYLFPKATAFRFRSTRR